MPRFKETERIENAVAREESATKLKQGSGWLKLGLTFKLVRVDEVTTEFEGDTYTNTVFVTDGGKDFYPTFTTKEFEEWDDKKDAFTGKVWQNQGRLCEHIRKIVNESPEDADDTTICNNVLKSKIGQKFFTDCVFKVTKIDKITIYNDWDDKPKRKRIYTIDIA